MLSGVRIHGPFTGPSGYDHHVREFVRELNRRSVGVELVNLNEWTPVRLPHHFRDPWFESLAKPVDSRVTLHFSFPTQVRPDSSTANVNFTMFEANRIPSAWVKAHSRSNLIVLPTEHSRRAWVESGVPVSKLRMCPLGVRSERFRPGVPALPLSVEGGRRVESFGVRLLNISELGPRKNLSGLMRAWLRATKPSDDAVLIMKVGCYAPGSLASFQAEIGAAQEAVGKSLNESAPVVYLYDLFPDADMPRLFAAATHYISLSLGEGWDLAMIEAASSGLRLIAPAHSGYLAYLDAEVATMVPSRLRPVRLSRGTWENELFEGASWWEPDEDAAMEAIRRAIDRQDMPRESARERVGKRFSWEAACDRLVEILNEANGLRSQ
jgi:glycosyltransferase involved in cell wall biosynthesis